MGLEVDRQWLQKAQGSWDGHAAAWENGCKGIKAVGGVSGPPRPQLPSAHSKVVRAAGTPASREQLVPVGFLWLPGLSGGSETFLIWAELAIVVLILISTVSRTFQK